MDCRPGRNERGSSRSLVYPEPRMSTLSGGRAQVRLVAAAVVALAAMFVSAGSASARDAVTPPVLENPGSITIPATFGCRTTWWCATFDPNVLTVDDASFSRDQITINCNGANGWTYLAGQTMVTCTAFDPDGNQSAPAAFTLIVTIPSPMFQNVPGPISFPATGPAGGPATFVPPTANDLDGLSDPVTCDHQSGIVYPVGTTTVTCTATITRNDSNGTPIQGLPTATTQFTITITNQSSGGGGGGGGAPGGGGGGTAGGGTPPTAEDTTAPTIAAHRDLTVDATGKTGVIVRYAVTATDPDNAAAQIVIGCSPTSGSRFSLAVGGRTKRTTVTCQAHDPAGNGAAPISFTVTVLGFHDQITALELFVNGSSLSPARKVALTTTLTAANRNFASSRKAAARTGLKAFITEVKKLPLAHARQTAWIADATRAAALAD
jgi:uncharacterized membrane protein YgcG